MTSDVCQAVIDRAIESGAPISNEDFRILNGCIDHAIADAVTEFSRARDLRVAKQSNERLGVLAHEIRNLLYTATLTFNAVKVGRVGMMGATAAVLERTLGRLGALVAIKFTDPGGHVALSAHATVEDVRIDVADECGGLPPGKTELLFKPFEQVGKDHCGIGLGLSIARRGAEVPGGGVHVRDVPGRGCVFTVALPRAR